MSAQLEENKKENMRKILIQDCKPQLEDTDLTINAKLLINQHKIGYMAWYLFMYLNTLEIKYFQLLNLLRHKGLYAVKAQTSLAPLSRFHGSHITTVHEQQCCRFQIYAKTVPSPMKFTSENDKAWTTFLGSTTTDHGLWRLTLTAYYRELYSIWGHDLKSNIIVLNTLIF